MSERKYFTYCECDKCKRMADVLEQLLATLEDGIKESRAIDDHTPLAFVLNSFVQILEYMFGDSYNGLRIATTAAASLKEFIHQESMSQAVRLDLMDAMSTMLPSMLSSGGGLVKMNVEDLPEDVLEALRLMVGRRGGGSSNLH